MPLPRSGKNRSNEMKQTFDIVLRITTTDTVFPQRPDDVLEEITSDLEYAGHTVESSTIVERK